MAESAEDQEWRGLFAQLQEKPEPLPSSSAAPLFDDASARGRVGLLITRAVFGNEQYQLYRLYCGLPTPRV
jgi:hypothetical protein